MTTKHGDGVWFQLLDAQWNTKGKGNNVTIKFRSSSRTFMEREGSEVQRRNFEVGSTFKEKYGMVQLLYLQVESP